MILVTGATGTAGSEVVRALVGRGRRVRVFVRDAGKARRLFGDAVEPAVGDFADPRSVRAALEGVEDLVLSGADDPRRVEWEARAIDAAAAAGVRRIVKLSSIAAAPGAPVAFWDWHGRIEEHLKRSGLRAVVLQSSPYMSNVIAGAEPEGRLYAPAGDARIAMIDPRDVGAAAAAVLTTDGHDGRTYVLTGAAAITYAEAAAALSAATGREVAFVDLPDADARRAMTGSGMPDAVAGEVVKLFAQLRAGAAERVTTTVEELTGRPARDFAAFARDHASVFNKALIRRVFEEVIPNGDVAGMRDLMAPDFLDHDPLPGQPAGAEGGEYVVTTMHTAHPDLRFTIDDLVAEGDRVTIRWTLRGTNTGAMLGRPPTGQPVELKAIAIFRIAGGKIAERWAGWKPGFAPLPA
jgi:steroid delta-isomerase-like uncharacterized protein